MKQKTPQLAPLPFALVPPPPIPVATPVRKHPMALGEMKQLAQSHTEAGIRRLIKIIDDDEQPGHVHVSAVNALLDRSYGKAKQPVELSDKNPFEDMTDAEIEASARLIALKMIAGLVDGA